MRIATEIIKIAKKKGIMIATAESCTAGMVATALTDIPGSSNVIDRGYVTYSDDAKTEMLGVLSTTLASHGAVS
jgi:nicotinamide-nucleotide amidase